MTGLRTAAAAGLGYLAGTIPSADFAARLASGGPLDLRTTGTGNPGGANVLKVLGPRWGYSVMVADIAKAAVATGVARRLAGSRGAHVAGSAAVVGHCFPMWNGFKGGKGVGCSVGQCLMTFPAYFPFDLAVAAVTSTRRWRSRTFVATAVASVAWVCSAVVWWRRRWPNAWGPAPTADLPLAAAASSVVILYKFASAGRWPEEASPSGPPPETGEQS